MVSMPTRVPEKLTDAGRIAIRSFGRATSRWRPDPEFLIIGAKRGGTTSFYFDLLEHPNITPLFPRPEHLPKATATKGIHFFDQNYWRGESWYRSHLPSELVRQRHARRTGLPVITGEASPYYLFHPAAAQRAHDLLPDAKIIAVLRDPVQRTYSHWKERRRSGGETLTFADALAAESERVGDVESRLIDDPRFYSYAHENLSYARQSEYARDLARWYELYPADRFLILASEDYYRDPKATLARTATFLGLAEAPLGSGVIRNAAAGSDLDPATAAELADRFAPHNQALRDLTGEAFPWP